MYTLEWTHGALVMLGKLWVEADEWERREIMAALRDIITELTDRPELDPDCNAGLPTAVISHLLDLPHRPRRPIRTPPAGCRPALVGLPLR